MSGQDDDYITHAREWWREAKQEHPIATTVAEVLPVTGQIAAAADYADAIQQGNTADGVEAALSFIPGIKLGKAATKLAPAAVRLAMTRGEKVLDPIVRRAPAINNTTNAVQVAQTAKETAGHGPDEAMAQAYHDAQAPQPKQPSPHAPALSPDQATKLASQLAYQDAWNAHVE